jgi:hypothetical protein
MKETYSDVWYYLTINMNFVNMYHSGEQSRSEIKRTRGIIFIWSFVWYGNMYKTDCKSIQKSKFVIQYCFWHITKLKKIWKSSFHWLSTWSDGIRSYSLIELLGDIIQAYCNALNRRETCFLYPTVRTSTICNATHIVSR